MMKQAFKILAASIALVGAVGIAQASPYKGSLLDGNGNVLTSQFSGFDWASNGTEVIQGWNDTITGPQSVNITFFAIAAAITAPGGAGFTALNNGKNLNTDVQYTIVLNMTAQATCAFMDASNRCQMLMFGGAGPTGGYSIFYDTNMNANMATGTGFTDGVEILTGAITGYQGNFSLVSAVAGFGAGMIQGTVSATSQGNNYVNPVPSSTNAGVMLQFGDPSGIETEWTAATGLPGANGAATKLPGGVIQIQADGNQHFAKTNAVPEPTSLALIGVALAGLGVMRRRKVQ